MVFDFGPQAFDMDVYSPGISDILISPDMVQQLFPGKDLIGGRGEEI